MNLLLASSEIHPYSKTGGLADMVGAMGKTLTRAGHKVGLVTPLYHGIGDRFPELKPAKIKLEFPLGASHVQGRVLELEAEPGLTVYFIDQPDYYDRGGLYQEDGSDYPDNPSRFIFLAKSVVQLARQLPASIDVVHAHDWQVGLVPLFIHHLREREGWGNAPATCFTVHNLAYQGLFSADDFALTNLPRDYFNPEGIEYYGKINCLKAGIQFADVITTVSPRYSREVMTEEFGCGLDGCLRARQDRFFGILNGVDYEEWNTDKNPHITHPYSVIDLSGKKSEKLSLQRELGLSVNAGIPLFGCVTRLAEQKGIDILLPALEEMLPSEMQFAIIGSGTPANERALKDLGERFRRKVAVTTGMHPRLAHRIEAASDFYLMPSRYEPCGLNQMYSLRYGTVPIVRITGGLDDTVIDIKENAEYPNGIKFEEYSSKVLARAIAKALELYRHPELLAHFRRNGMTADFSWERTAGEYIKRYQFARNGSAG